MTSGEGSAGAEASNEPVLAVVDADDSSAVDEALGVLGVADAEGVQEWLAARPAGRPAAFALGDGADDVLVVRIAVVVDDVSLSWVRALCCERGLLVMTDRRDALDDAVTTIAGARTPNGGLACLLSEVGRLSEDRLETFALDVQDGFGTRPSFLSQQQRSGALGIRRSLLALSGVFDAQHRLVDDDEDVLEARVKGSRHLAVARHRFAYVSDLARRLYDAAGDELSQQSSLITEQLTLVNTVFLPLTLAASFFGMNFGWLTDRIGSARAFVLLGVGVPVVLALATVLITNRLRHRPPREDG